MHVNLVCNHSFWRTYWIIFYRQRQVVLVRNKTSSGQSTYIFCATILPLFGYECKQHALFEVTEGVRTSNGSIPFFFSFLIGEGQYYFLTQFVNKTLVVDNLIYPKFGWFPIVMILVKHGQYLLFLSDFIVHSQAIWEISLITRSETLVLCNFIFHSFWPYGCVSFINMALT